MIKITYKGFEIEVSDINEAKQLIGSNEPHSFPMLDKKLYKDKKRLNIGRPKGSKDKKKRAINIKSKWSNAEIKYLIENMGKTTLKEISRSATNLLENHTPKAILLMGWRITSNNKNYRVSPEIQDLIDSYHAKKRLQAPEEA